MAIRRLVIDVLIPHEPDVLTYANLINDLPGTDGITIDVVENDERTKTVEITIEGEDLPFENIKQVIEDTGGSIHSIDQVSAGNTIVKPGKHSEE